MALLKDILVLAAYFLLLSTVLQTEDAWVVFYESENPPTAAPATRARQLFIFAVFAILYYLVLVFAPFLNLSTKTLALVTAGLLFLKYVSELLTFSRILINIFELSAIFLDVIGQALFYLTTVRLIQLICEKNNCLEKAGRCLCVFPFIYGLSMTIGYALAEPMFRSLPAWLFLIILTCMTAVALVIAYCTFGFELAPPAPPSDELHEEQPYPDAQTPSPATPAINEQQGASPVEQPIQPQMQMQIYRGGMQLGDIVNITIGLYSKMILVIPVQLNLGILLAYGPQLLEYLVWTTQTESIRERLEHNMLVMVIYGLGAAFASVLVGTLADIFSIRRLGYGVMIFSSFVLCMMYFALGIKYFYTTFLLYMFLGMATFSLYTWLVCACSKIYGGKFEIFAVNMQVMGLAFTSYTAANILFGGVVKINLILGIQLAWLIIGCVTSICFVRRLPLGPIDIEFEESAPETSRSQPPSPAPDASIDQKRVEIEMTSQARRMQKQLTGQPKMNAEMLL